MLAGYKEELERRATRPRTADAGLLQTGPRERDHLLSERDLRSLEWLPADDMTSLRV